MQNMGLSSDPLGSGAGRGDRAIRQAKHRHEPVSRVSKSEAERASDGREFADVDQRVGQACAFEVVADKISGKALGDAIESERLSGVEGDLGGGCAHPIPSKKGACGIGVLT